jgi:hypothetical protein
MSTMRASSGVPDFSSSPLDGACRAAAKHGHHTAPGIELDRDGVSAGVFLHYRDDNRVFDGFAAWDVTAHTLTEDGLAERVRSAAVTPELFDVLRVVPLIGRVPTATDYAHDMTTAQGPMGALLGHELWVRRVFTMPAPLETSAGVTGEERGGGRARDGRPKPSAGTAGGSTRTAMVTAQIGSAVSRFSRSCRKKRTMRA